MRTHPVMRTSNPVLDQTQGLIQDPDLIPGPDLIPVRTPARIPVPVPVPVLRSTFRDFRGQALAWDPGPE